MGKVRVQTEPKSVEGVTYADDMSLALLELNAAAVQTALLRKGELLGMGQVINDEETDARPSRGQTSTKEKVAMLAVVGVGITRE